MKGKSYIYEKNNRFRVIKSIKGSTKNFGNYETLEEAIFARDLLIEHDWNLDEVIPSDHVIKFNGEFWVVTRFRGKLKFLGKFNTRNDAKGNVANLIKEFQGNPYGRQYGTYIYKIGEYFDVKKSINNKELLFGSYANLDDATFARDLLVMYDWNLMDILKGGPIFFSKIHKQYLVVPVIDDKVVIINHYDSKIDALLNVGEDLEMYIKYQTKGKQALYRGDSKVNRYILKKHRKFWIRKKIDGELRILGPYDTKWDAIEARDELELRGWQLHNHDEESIFYDELDDEDYEDIIFNLSMWQKIVYDTIVRIGKVRFSLDDLLNHSYLKRYKSGKNFDEKVITHLNELIDWGLVASLGGNMYLRRF